MQDLTPANQMLIGMKMEDTACLALAIKDEDVKEEEEVKEEVVVEESKEEVAADEAPAEEPTA